MKNKSWLPTTYFFNKPHYAFYPDCLTIVGRLPEIMGTFASKHLLTLERIERISGRFAFFTRVVTSNVGKPKTHSAQYQVLYNAF